MLVEEAITNSSPVEVTAANLESYNLKKITSTRKDDSNAHDSSAMNVLGLSMTVNGLGAQHPEFEHVADGQYTVSDDDSSSENFDSAPKCPCCGGEGVLEPLDRSAKGYFRLFANFATTTGFLDDSLMEAEEDAEVLDSVFRVLGISRLPSARCPLSEPSEYAHLFHHSNPMQQHYLGCHLEKIDRERKPGVTRCRLLRRCRVYEPFADSMLV